MTKPSDKTKQKKFTRTPGSKTKVKYDRAKTGKHKCSLCQKVLHGMPHGRTPAEVRKLSKTERRPSALLAGTLCNQCRTLALEEAFKVKAGLKDLNQVSLMFRQHVQDLQGRLK